MPEYNTVYTSQSSQAVFTGVWAGAGAGQTIKLVGLRSARTHLVGTWTLAPHQPY